MRILIINPNSDQATETILRETAEKFVQKRFEFDVVSMTTSPKLVVSYEDQYASAAELAQTIRSSLDKYDAFVLACHADPNYDLAKEVACGKPVFGIAEPSAGIIPKKFALARKYHVEEQLKAVVVSKGNDKQSLLEAAEEALKYPNVSAIVLGCANYAGSDAYIEKKLNVPVYDGVIWALILAEGAVRNKLYQLENKE